MNAATSEKQLWLVRHGSNGIFSENESDPPLSAQGREEIARLAQYLAARRIPGPVLILSSTDRRNQETAEIITDSLRARDGSVLPYSCDAVASGERKDMAAMLYLLSSLDSLARIGLAEEGDTPAGSLILIGNRRNALLEMLSVIADPATEIADIRGKGERPDDIDLREVFARHRGGGWMGDYLVNGDDPMKLFEKAALAGYRLTVPRWRDCAQAGFARKIAARNFSATPAAPGPVI